MSLETHLAGLAEPDAITAVIWFADHPDERALEPLFEIALDPARLEDERYYAAEACLAILGPESFARRFVDAYQRGAGPVRHLALLAIASWAPEQAVDFVRRCLDSDDPEVLATAIRTLGRLDSVDASPRIRLFLAHDHPSVQQAARDALDTHAPDDVFASALKQLQSKDPQAQFAGASHFARKPDVRARHALATIITDPSQPPRVRQRSVVALANSRDPEAFDVVHDALRSGDEELAAAAARAIGRFEDPRALDALGTFLVAPGDEFCHSEAALGMGILGHAGATPHLLQGLHDSRAVVRQWSCDAFSKIDIPDSHRAEIARALERRFASDEEPDVRGYAARALGHVRDPDSFAVLAEAVRGEDADEAWDAAWALVDYDDPRALEAVRAGYEVHGTLLGEAAARIIDTHGDACDVPLARRIVEEGELAGFKALGGIDSREALSTVLDLLEVADGFERIPALGAAARLGHAKSADELAELTDTEDGHWAAIELVRAGDRRGLEPCIAAVGSDYHDVCRSAMEVLGSYGDTSAIDSLSDRFEGPNDEHRAVARRALRKLGRAV